MKRLMTDRSETLARNAGSVCRMEALEPRLLLADELFIGLGDVVFRDGPQLPDDKIEIPVTFQNVSGVQVTGKVRIQIWASPDDVLGDPDDFLVFEGNISINPRPNEIQTKKVKGRLPLNTLPAEYNFIVDVIDQSMLNNGASFAPGGAASVDDESFVVRWVFGAVQGRSGNTTLKFMNTSGVVYKINFSQGFNGYEFGEVESQVVVNRNDRGAPPPGDQFLHLEIDNGDDGDRVSVRRAGGPSDPDLFYLTGIDVDTNLSFFDAPDLTLLGPAYFDGLAKLFLGNVTYADEVDIDNVIEFGPFRGHAKPVSIYSERVSIKVKHVLGTIFDIRGTLANMQALSFGGFLGGASKPLAERGEGELGGIEANFIDKVNIAGDFEGFVFAQSLETLVAAERINADTKFPERVINAFIVKGELSGGLLAFGDVAKLEAGSIDVFEAAVLGRLERLNVKNDLGFFKEARGGFATNIIGATEISRVDIGGSLLDTQLFAGLDGIFPMARGGGYEFGDLYQGSIANASYTSGIIGRVNIGGDMFIAEVAAGVDPDGSGVFGDGFLVGDSSVSRIGPIKVGGELGKARFVSGDFPDNISINGSSYSTITNPDGVVLVVFPLI